ncbi:MAG TPA: 30S ribosomal protein S4 [Candidatus Saccharimonadia bacterium]|nr:30S ribosomal protein S4 [Candidatus Saccharimonadia bacterium]
MARYTGPKNRLARKVGADLSMKTNILKLNKRLNVRPGLHGKKIRRKRSEYGEQLTEKQKVKHLYGVMEKQFRKLYEKASKTPASTGKVLLILLERRLDNAVYRLGFAPTRAAARQMVTHGHVKVNGEKVSIPSYSVNMDEVVTLSATAMKIPAVAELLKEKDKAVPKWLERTAAAGKIAKFPEREDIDAGINEQMIVEFYSR